MPLASRSEPSWASGRFTGRRRSGVPRNRRPRVAPPAVFCRIPGRNCGRFRFRRTSLRFDRIGSGILSIGLSPAMTFANRRTSPRWLPRRRGQRGCTARRLKSPWRRSRWETNLGSWRETDRLPGIRAALARAFAVVAPRIPDMLQPDRAGDCAAGARSLRGGCGVSDAQGGGVGSEGCCVLFSLVLLYFRYVILTQTVPVSKGGQRRKV